MANYCIHDAFITGERESLQVFRNLLRTKASYGRLCRHEWLESIWITESTWIEKALIEDNEIYLAFNWKWSPAKEFIQVFSEKFPHLHFDVNYYESQTLFAGSFQYEQGTLTNEVFYDSEFNPKEWKQFMWVTFGINIKEIDQ